MWATAEAMAGGEPCAASGTPMSAGCSKCNSGRDAEDPGGLLLGAMKRLHLAWNVVRISPERQAQKAAAATG